LINKSVTPVDSDSAFMPARQTFTPSPKKKEIAVEFAGCLECGTCMIACVDGSVKWKYPKSGFGVQYRFG
jgi:ferredoxin like protein